MHLHTHLQPSAGAQPCYLAPDCALNHAFSFHSAAPAGAKLFYLSGVRNGKYMKREVHNLARFISVMKFRPLSWRTTHPYLVADRWAGRESKGRGVASPCPSEAALLLLPGLCSPWLSGYP